MSVKQREQETGREEEGRERTRHDEQGPMSRKEDLGFEAKEVGAVEGFRERREGSSLGPSQGPSTG